MIVRQYLHTDPAIGASYLLGCGGKASGAVIDPMGAIEPYLKDAARLDLKILYVIDTHVHADHRSSARELAEKTAAKYVLHESVNAAFHFHPARDGDTIELGNVVLTLWHTPGHTPEHLCILVTDRTRATEPWMVLTGHTLMVGDLGRTELTSRRSSLAPQRATPEKSVRLSRGAARSLQRFGLRAQPDRQTRGLVAGDRAARGGHSDGLPNFDRGGR
jgi:hydroxyacylglutathione hydrolase